MGDEAPRIRDELRHGFLTGVAVIVPLLITLIVLAIAFNYIYDYLDLFSDVILPFSPQIVIPYYGVVEREILVEIASPVVLLLIILFVGLVANSSRYGQRAVDYFDYIIEQIPGVGSVYESFRQMSDVMLESDDENFQEVVLVEFPTEGTYAVAFVTSETPESISDPVGKGEMTTLFMPMAPNPVMGGHVVFVPNDRIVEVDMTVEEGIRALVTSGVAIGEATGGSVGLSESQLRELSTIEQIEQRLDPGRTVEDLHRQDAVDPERPEKYDEAVDPEQARTPDSIVQRERDEAEAAGSAADRTDAPEGAEATVTPAERAGRYEAAQEETDAKPSERAGRPADESESTEGTPSERAGRTAAESEPTETKPSERSGRPPEDREETDAKPSEIAGRRSDGDGADEDGTDGVDADEGGTDEGGANEGSANEGGANEADAAIDSDTSDDAEREDQ